MKANQLKQIIFYILLVLFGNKSSNGQALNKSNIIGPNLVSCSLKDKNGNLWFGTTEKGIYRYDGKIFKHFSEKSGLTNYHIFSLYQDKKGTIWIGTFGGLFKYDGTHFTHVPIPHPYKIAAPDAMGNIVYNPNCILSICEDKNGNLWFGSMGFGVYQYIIDNKEFNFFIENKELNKCIIQCILESKDGKIWFGTRGQGLWIYEKNHFTNYTSKIINNNHLLNILEDTFGNFWFSNIGGGVRLYKKDLHTPFDYDGQNFKLFDKTEGSCFLNVFGMLEDNQKNIWFCGDGGGVCKFDGKSFKSYSTKDGLASNKVTTIVEDNNGYIWLGMRGAELSCFDGENFVSFVLQTNED
jgi:ligand-binding sensor domain-containing protein